MSIPQLFYLGIFAGLLHRIPGIDLGTIIFALSLNNDLFAEKFKKTVVTTGVASLGFVVTLLIPLYRFDPILYYFSEKILAFFFGFILYSIVNLSYRSHLGDNVFKFGVASSVLVFAILFKSLATAWNIQGSLFLAFLQNFFILLPGLRLNIMSISSVLEIFVGTLGIMSSLFLLVKFQKIYEKGKYLVLGLMTASLVDLWPWRSFQNISYSMEGTARWIKDYPVWPNTETINLVITLIFFFIGIISSWILTKTMNQRIILVHE
jgi:hypothetical protein